MSTAKAEIINVGKRKYIPALHVTLPDGTTYTSRGKRAITAEVVAIRKCKQPPYEGEYTYTDHRRRDLALTWDPFGLGQAVVDEHYELVEILTVTHSESTPS